MIRPIDLSSEAEKDPLYARIWQQLKTFPHVLAQGSKSAPKVSGTAAAALISAGFGCFLMMVTHHLADTSAFRDKIVWAIGSWIPGSHNPSELWGNIGSYTGKETMLLIGWLVSWLILHSLWKNKHIKTRTIFFWMFALFVTATAMSWHPLFPYLSLM